MEIVLFTVVMPLSVMMWFIYDLVTFLQCPKEQAEKRKRKFWAMITSGTVMVFYVGIMFGLILWLSSAVEHM